MRRMVILTGVVLSLANRTYAQSSGTTSEQTMSERVATLLSQMTLTEKVHQVRVFHSNLGIELDEQGRLDMSDKVKVKLAHGIAGIKNPGTELAPARGIELCNQLQRYIIANNRLGIPALFITECYSGVDAVENTVLARPITMASTWNTELVQQAWDIVGKEARARGMHLCHSPEGDLARDPRFGRMSETFGEDTYLVSRMITSAIRGVQGGGAGLKGTHIGACAKHFAGYACVEGGRNFAAVQISPRSFIDEILPPFKAAVQEGACLGIMASHADINGEASHANRHLLTTILRERWGFKGYVISDSHDIERLHFFMGVAESFEAAATMALTAGVDIDLYGDQGYAFLEDIIAKQPELLPTLDRAVGRVLMTKERLGLFDNPYYDVEQTKTVTRSAVSLDLALQTDLESIVLLKNRKNLLPLDPKTHPRIAVIGPLADARQIEAIEKAAGPGATVKYTKGCGITREDKRSSVARPEDDAPLIQEAVALARQSDVVIAFLGGNEYTSKEAYFNSGIGDRDSLDPVGQQSQLMQALKATGVPVVLALKHRRTLSFVILDACAAAVIDCWELSERGHEAIARILFGQANPSGKLPVTVPRSVGQLPAYYSQKHINFKKGYLFTPSDPLYPFGHGLSYTTFDYANLKITDRGTAEDVDVTVRFDVTNTGDRTGKEVCQLYVRDVIGSVTRPAKELKDFVKVELKPGETRAIQFKLTTEKLAFTGKDMRFAAEPGDFEVLVGGSSQTGLKGSFRLN